MAPRFLHYSAVKRPPRVARTTEFGAGGGPYGVYAWPEGASAAYATHRAFVYELTPLAPITDTRSYSARDLAADLQRLRALIGEEQFGRLERGWHKYKQGFRAHELPAAALWYFVTKASDDDEIPSLSAPSTDHPRFATDLFVELGHKIISDRAGIIWSSEPEQAVFFTDDSFSARLVERERAPVRNPGHFDRVREMYRERIIEGMARRLWVFAWMNHVTEHGPPCPECDDDSDRIDMGDGTWECQRCSRLYRGPDPKLEWFELAPLTPRAARQAAEDLADLIQTTDGDDILMLFEGAMLFDQGEHFEWTATEEKRKTVLVLPEANARLAYDFGNALASESLLPGVAFDAWARDHVVKRGQEEFLPKLPSFRVEYFDGNLNWSGESEWLGAGSGTLIDEAIGKTPDGVAIHAELRDSGGDPTVRVRAGAWRLEIDRNADQRNGTDQRWFRSEGRRGDHEVAAAVIPIPTREAMIRLGVRLWRARVEGATQ